MLPKKKWKEPSAVSSNEPTSKNQKPSLEELHTIAIKALTRRPFPTRELEQKLLRTGSDVTTIQRVIERLKASGYLDDRQFAEGFIQSRLHKAQGCARVERELRARGVHPTIVREELAKAYSPEAERESLNQALERKLRSLASPVDAKKISRLYNQLLRRGFPSEAIRLELRRHLKMDLDWD